MITCAHTYTQLLGEGDLKTKFYEGGAPFLRIMSTQNHIKVDSETKKKMFKVLYFS